MIKKIVSLCLFFVLLYCSTAAQNPKQKWQFKSTNLIGNLIGEQGSNFSMQSINGFGKNNWSIGLGVGIDPYGYSSIPVFIDFRKSFGKKAWQPFVYGDGGPSFPLSNPDLPKTWPSGSPAFDLQTGWMAEIGFGVQKKISSNTHFVFQIGYSHKYYSYVNQNGNFGFLSSFWPQNSTNEYQFRRWAIRMGVTL